MHTDPARALEALLEEERATLKCGDFARLADLSLAKLGALDALSEQASMVRRDLLEQSRRNSKLLEAAAAGLRAGQARLKELRQAAEARTYGPDGRAQPASRPGTTRRA